MEYYFKTDFQIVETFTDSTGVPIDLNDFDFELIYQTTGVYNYKAFKKGEVLINCSIDTVDSSKLIVVFQNHKLSCGQLHREIKIKALNPLFKDYQQIMTHPFTEIYLVQNGGDQTTGYASAGIPIVLPYSETIVTDLSDTDYFFGMSLSLKSFIKITWLDIKAKLKTYFDTLFEPKKAATDLYVTQAEKSTWNAKQDALSADVDYLTPTTASTTYEPKKGENDNYVTDDEKTVIENTSGENTGDETAESIIDKIGTDGQIKSDYLMNILEPVQVTYEELYALKQSNNLTQNQLYEITDYRNRYQQAVSKEILTSETEPLIIKAISNNSFSTKAYSKLYPQDEIYYNFENTMDENPILAPGADRGFIFRRIDTKQRNDFPFDFRNIKFRRWQVTGNEWDAATVYFSKSIVKRNGFLYIGVGNNNVGIDPELNNNTITTLDSYAWIKCNFADMSYVSDTPTGLIGTLQFAVTGLYQDYLMFSTGEIYSMAKNNIALYDWHPQSSHNDSHLFAAFNTVFKKESLNPRTATYSGVTNNQIGGDFFRNTILWDFSANKTSVSFYINLICDLFDNNLIHSHFRYNYMNKWVTHGTFTDWQTRESVFGNEINASSFLCYGGFCNSIIAGMCFRVLSIGYVNNIIAHKNIAYSDFSGMIENAVFKKEIAYTKSHNSLSNSTINARLDNVTFEGGIIYLTTGEAEIKDVVFGKNIANADLTTLIYPITPCRIEIVEGTPEKLCIKYLNSDGRQCYSIVGLDASVIETGVYETETNKESDVETYKESITKYPTLKGLYDWATSKFIALSKLVTTWSATPTHDNIPSEKLVKDSLNLKADITPANGSTSALRALFIARSWNRAAFSGAERYELTYNANTGYYEMYGVNDLTEEDVAHSYIMCEQLKSSNWIGALAYTKVRVNFPMTYYLNSGLNVDMSFFARENKIIEKIILDGYYGVVYGSNYMRFCTGCVNLNEVRTLMLDNITNVVSVAEIFLNCPSLVTCYIKNIKVSISFGSSPLLSLASLQYLVTNRANGTSRITITVHATVWAKLNDAVNYPEWNALLVDAVNNQYIDFASA